MIPLNKTNITASSSACHSVQQESPSLDQKAESADAPSGWDMRALGAKFISGGFAKMIVNNPNRSIALYQQGFNRLDLSFATARGQLLSSSIQSLVVYNGRDLLQVSDEPAESVSEFGTTFLKNFSVGFAAGSVMYPLCMPFYFVPAEKYRTGFLPSFNSFRNVVAKSPSLLYKAMFPKAMNAATEFGCYFTFKNEMKKHFDNPVEVEVASSTPAILLAIPWHQRFIHLLNKDIENSPFKDDLPPVKPVKDVCPDTLRNSLKTRFRIAFVAFTIANIVELATMEALKRLINGEDVF